ncbi:MAG TPA: glycoside hydrolase family 15 protein [Acidobacteriaceae bacterium]|nr:glycoside hydrolase family 15 protein [Acidobacteriaceae bacterium]
MAERIEDYALIGDCETAALVDRHGSIDWLCWPRFDSPACFAALLGGPEHGRWKLAPVAATTTRRSYRPDTLILETEFTTETGICRLTDLMPQRDGNSDVVRIVTGVRGEVAMRMELTIRCDYGRTVPWVRRLDDGRLRAIAGPHSLVLSTTAPVRGESLSTLSEFTVAAGQQVPFVLTYGPSHLNPATPADPQAAVANTEAFWRDWASRCTVQGPWSDVVRRSLITLKALTYDPTGGIVAAATTSLPELPGGGRNWDYRFCWLRDATFTLLSLMDAGYFEEAYRWRDWLVRAAAGEPSQIQIMYGLAGERDLSERELPWLPGYAGSRPVRIGNAAAEQFQLDVFGEVADALHHARKGDLGPSETAWRLQQTLTDHLEKVWAEHDEGLWEVRGPRQCFTHSKVMAWVAFDRAVKAVEDFGLDGPVERWRTLREYVHSEICSKAFSTTLGSFVQAYGSQQLDASLLLMPLVGFLPASDPRIIGTVNAIERRLTADGLVLRYDTEHTQDGLAPGEGAFLACSFWLADNYVLQGRIDDARHLFERLLRLANDVGLLAEEYEPQSKQMVGNYPQAFSHVALVNTALNLTRWRGPAEQRGGEEIKLS